MKNKKYTPAELDKQARMSRIHHVMVTAKVGYTEAKRRIDDADDQRRSDRGSQQAGKT